MNIQSSNDTLSGYRALDLTDEKGMFCPRLLADMGAEVVRIETPVTAAARNHYYQATSRGKLGITLNIETRKGQEIFHTLIKTADIIVESYPPGYLAALGIGYETLNVINPRLIMVSITGFGQDGPYRDYKSCDLVAQAIGGQLYVNGEPARPPLKAPGNQPYYITGLFAAVGILLALNSRHTSGRGQYIDTSLMECVAASLDHVLVRYFAEQTVAQRQGGQHWNSAFRIFPCRDGHVLLTLFHQWSTLVEWLDSEGMAGDLSGEEWQIPEHRRNHQDHIIEVLERWVKTHTVTELVEKGQAMRFPWAEVADLPRLMANPQLEERRFWVQGEPPAGRLPGPTARLSRSPWRPGNTIPTPGEHNRTIYHQLGLAPGEINTLETGGVI